MSKGYDKKNFNKEEYAEKKASEIKEIVNGGTPTYV